MRQIFVARDFKQKLVKADSKVAQLQFQPFNAIQNVWKAAISNKH